MTIREPEEPILSKAHAELLPHLIGALQRAYADACDARGRYPGANEMTFGTDVYHFAKHEIGGVGERTNLLKILQAEAPRFRFLSDGRTFACHKVGHHASDDIETSFPKARGAANMMTVQLDLPGVIAPPTAKEVRAAMKVVVAHMGNHEHGLCAVHFCLAAGDAEDETIRQWAHTECVWKRDAAEGTVGPTGGAGRPRKPVDPENELDGEPRRKDRKERGEETD
jgi:hypothetical protein